MENSEKPKVSIVILSWNTQKLLEQCLKSIPFFVEIIVVDNGSTDGTLHFLDSLKWPNLKVIKNQTNLGFAKGNNQGIKIANGDLIMLLNSDTIVQKGAIEKLVSFYEKQKDKNIAFSPLLLNLDGTVQTEYYLKFPNLWQTLFYHNPILRFLIMKIFLRKLIVNDLNKIQKGEPFEIAPLQGAALMVPKEVWRKVGFLDEDYHFLFEDVDWSWRSQKAGVKLFLVPQAKITHFGGASWQKKNLNKASFEFYCQHFDSFLLFVGKNYGKRELNIFRRALIFNFLLRFKFKLAKYFLD
ncbi:MAG: glycosyltransferase family 2 protein [Candidatus Shapirobacteria bacterium]|nr:glycosyltransferase family 2 protein [Candidatus Shapirobacteria bacterium]